MNVWFYNFSPVLNNQWRRFLFFFWQNNCSSVQCCAVSYPYEHVPLLFRPISLFSLSGFPLWSMSRFYGFLALCVCILWSLATDIGFFLFKIFFEKNSDLLSISKVRFTKHAYPTFAWLELVKYFILFVFLLAGYSPLGHFYEGCFWNVNVIDLILQLILFYLHSAFGKRE